MTGASARRVTQQGRELRKRTLPPDPGPILSAARVYATDEIALTPDAYDARLDIALATAG
jgi:hypothetical protein